MDVLYLICGAAPPSRDIARILPRAQALGWDVWVVPTPHAVAFLDIARIEAGTGHQVRHQYRLPDDAQAPAPAAVIAAPLTFNSLNKWAAGICDTYALGVLTEAIGEGRQVVAVPWAKRALTSHPIYGRNIELLRAVGVHVLDARYAAREEVDLEVPTFPWAEALAALPPR